MSLSPDEIGQNEDRIFQEIINYVEDQVGADVDRDLIMVEITDMASQSDVATETTLSTIADALASDDTDSLTTIIQDSDGDEAIVAPLDTPPGVSENGFITFTAGALNAVGQDELVVRITGDDGVQIAEEQLDTAIGNTDVGIVTYLARALDSRGQDELVTRVTGTDGVQIAEEQLDTALSATDVGLVTFVARALNSLGQDELVSRIADSGGTQIDPATTALENALKANDADELVTRVTGSDGAEIVDEQLDTAVSATDIALLTYVARALNSVGQDELVSRLANSSGAQIDPATTALEDALKSNDTDEFVSRVAGADGVEIVEEQLDTAVANTDVGLLTWVARALNSIGQDELVSRLTDSTGSQIDPDQSPDYPDNQTIEHDLDPNVSGDLVVGPVSVARAQAVIIAADSIDDQNWSASVDWEDDSGNVFRSESATDIGLSATDNDDARLRRKGPQVEVTFTSDVAAGTTNRINAFVGAHR